MATVTDALNVALQHHSSGNLAEAEGIYRQILAVEPANADALHLLGLIAHQVGRYELAVSLIGQAVTSRPDFAAAHGNLGAALKELGRLDRAVASQRAAIALDPGFFEAHCNLGAVLAQLGRADEALAAYDRALALNPDAAGIHTEVGNLLLHLGRLDEAAAAHRRAPDSPEAAYNLGVVLEKLGRLDEAVASYDKAIALAPGLVQAHYNLGNLLLVLNRPEEAAGRYRRVIGLDPRHADAHLNLGNALQDLGRFADAAACYEQAVAIRPDFAMAYNNLGNARKELALLDEAAQAYGTALALEPDHAQALNGLGNTLFLQGKHREAMDRFNSALSIDPDMADAYNNLGHVQKTMGLNAEALHNFAKALALRPDFAGAHENRAYLRFVQGDLKEGWEDYEWRWKGFMRHLKRPFPQPWWDGTPLDGGQTLLIWGEQGLGDEIMGAGMLADAARLGGPLVLECEPRLVDLFARSFPEVSVVARTDPPHPRTLGADLQIPLLSLARHFRTRPADFPSGGYLAADPVRARHWKNWLDSLGPGLKIGLSWKGRKTAGRPPYYPPLEKLSVILDLPGLVFVNLQYDEVAEDIATMRRDMGVEVHCPPGLDLTNDLDGVAALISNLDVVVGPLTVAVILAGALGRMAWLYAYYPVYGEMCILNLDYVPWCPSIRVEKYGFGEDRREALARVADGLRALTANG